MAANQANQSTADASLIRRETAWVPIVLECEAEVRDRRRFQADGHYVVSTVSGDQVHILTYAPHGDQLLRTQGRTEEEAARAFQEAAPLTWYALWARDKVQADAGRQLVQLHTERNRLAEFLAARYDARELPLGMGTTETVLWLLERERGRRMGRLWRWITGKSKPVALPSSTPEGGSHATERK